MKLKPLPTPSSFYWLRAKENGEEIYEWTRDVECATKRIGELQDGRLFIVTLDGRLGE